MAEKMKKERILGLDIIRVLALLFVFFTHGIAYNDLMNHDVMSAKWIFFVILRFTCMASVPLFLLLTGYLNNKTEISKKYYKGIIPLLLSYVFISLLEIVSIGVYTGASIEWGKEILSILNFSKNSYAWYFEMYIGLFLLIPFLNRLYDSLENKKEKYILVGSLIFLTFLPQMFKSFKVFEEWLNITPDYWQIIYPITYFYIGKMIKELKPKFSLIKHIALIVLAISIPCCFCIFFSRNGEYAWYTFNGFEALTDAFIAVSIFLLFYDFNKKLPVIGKIITEISICSFEMYLMSSIFDKYFYSKYPMNIFFEVPLVLVTTYITSKIWIILRDKIVKLLQKN